MRHAHVVGAGLAGLGAAVALAHGGFTVSVSEAARQAGGRCRSYDDAQLGQRIDNGNHLVLAGNAAVARYLAAIGASDRLAGPAHARFPFVDIATGERWTVRMNDGRLPWWIASPARRVPGTRLGDYLALRRLRGEGTVARVLADGPLARRLIAPLLIAALNTPLETASAALAATILRETVGAGGRACAPRVASPDLDAAFVAPALAHLDARGARVQLGRRLREIGFEGGRVASLDFGEETVAVGDGDVVVLAVPAWAAADLVPDLVVPDRHQAILNAHFALAPPAGAEPITGVVGGTAEWVFAFPERISVTVSAADALCEEDRGGVAARLWSDVCRTLGLDAALPPHRILAEKRATFAATPAQERRRPPSATRWRNLFLAGDWTATGLPATIEGALRSGETAGALAMERA